MFIERSRNGPLHILIDMKPDDDDLYGAGDYQGSMQPQTARIFPLVSRWRTLEIIGVNPRYMDILKALQHVDAPMLCDLRVECDRRSDPDDYSDPLHLFNEKGGAPTLAHLDISGFPCRVALTAVTSLRLRSFLELEVDMAQLVEASIRLVELQLHIDCPANIALIQQATGPSHEFPLLRHLRIALLQTEMPADECLIPWLVAPLLQNLTLEYRPRIQHAPALERALLSNKRPKWPRLQTMCLCRAEFTPSAAIVMIAGIPSVVHVVLIACERLFILFRELLHQNRDNRGTRDDGRGAWGESGAESGSSTSVCWPLLQTISLSSIRLGDVKPLCDVVRDRISNGGLIALNISSAAAAAIPNDALHWLQQNVGVRICAIGRSGCIVANISY